MCAHIHSYGWIWNCPAKWIANMQKLKFSHMCAIMNMQFTTFFVTSKCFFKLLNSTRDAAVATTLYTRWLLLEAAPLWLTAQ